jgi:hypothetical protein
MKHLLIVVDIDAFVDPSNDMLPVTAPVKLIVLLFFNLVARYAEFTSIED